MTGRPSPNSALHPSPPIHPQKVDLILRTRQHKRIPRSAQGSHQQPPALYRSITVQRSTSCPGSTPSPAADADTTQSSAAVCSPMLQNFGLPISTVQGSRPARPRSESSALAHASFWRSQHGLGTAWSARCAVRLRQKCRLPSVEWKNVRNRKVKNCDKLFPSVG